MPTVHVNDIDLYYEVHGEGDPLVMIPGLASEVSEYGEFIRRFALRYKVIAVDNRGAGRSDKPDSPYSIEMMAEDTAGLLAELGIQRAHILGVSMGGRIALALILKNPELVRSLILVSTAAKQAAPPLARRLLTESLLHVLRVRGSQRGPQPYYAIVRQRQASRSYDCTARLSEIVAPTLILHGKRDTTAPYPLAEEMRKGIRGSTLLSFPGGHIFFFLRPQPFIDAILGFLATV